MNGNIAIGIFEKYLISRNFSDKTVKKYYCDVRDFLLYCKKRDIRDINKEDILNYRKYLYECGKFVLSSQAGMIHTVSRFFRLLLKEDIILSNPFDTLDIHMIKREIKRESIPEEKLLKILDSINGNGYSDLRDRAIFEIMYGCGIRVGETVKLCMTDIDWKEGKIFINDGKGRKDRVVPVGQNALRVLKQYIEYGRSRLKNIVDREYLYLSFSGKKLNVSNIGRLLKKHTEKLYPGMRIFPHMLRHSFATHMLEAGANIKHIKDILGHSNMETTVGYTHFNARSMRKILKMYHPGENELYDEFDEEKIKKAIDKEK